MKTSLTDIERGRRRTMEGRVLLCALGLILPVLLLLIRLCADENIDTLKNRAVLDDGMHRLLHSQHILETLLEEISLQAKRPTLDIRVIVLEIRIETDALEARFPAIITRQHLGQRRLACSNISCDSYIHV